MFEIAAVIVGILFFSGFFSGSEAALVSITEADTETLIKQKKWGSKIMAKVQDQLNRAVITIVIFNNIVNIVGSIAVGRLVINLYDDAALAVITTGLTFGIIVISEIIPKALGIHYRERISLICSPIILVLMTTLFPLIYVLEKLTNLLKQGTRKVGTEDQIRSLVSIGQREGHIESDETQIIHRAFILNDKTAEDIMTPLKDIIGIQLPASVQDAADKLGNHPYSRYPVFGTSIHDIEGLVMSADVLEHLVDKESGMPLREVMRDALVVSHDEQADKLLVLFRDKSIHLAIVQEEGKTVGLVTLEDVLEELVGEIEDERDIED